MSNPSESGPRRILLTGSTGFIGQHVKRRLEGRSEVYSLVRSRLGPSDVEGDLRDPDSLEAAVATSLPDAVIHLAGATPPGQPKSYYQTNTLGTLHLLDALRKRNELIRVVIVGSAAELGPVELSDLPVAEDYRPRPADPYGRSKWLASEAALSHHPHLDVVIARVFNPVGPGLPESQALGRFASILASSSGPEVELTVGDLSARRDFVDVRDVARALVLLTERGPGGSTYHIGTGRSRTVGEGLDELILRSGHKVNVKADPDLAIRRGVADSRAEIGRIVAEVGWHPTISWEQSLADLWDEALLRLTGRAPVV